MPVTAKSSVTPETIDLVGTWRLIAATDWKNGVLKNPFALGERAAGYISYSCEGRMMVVLDRRSLEVIRGRYGREPIFAYAGGYTRIRGVVTHHLEMCTATCDIGTDYVRHIEVAGDHLILCTEPVFKEENAFVSKLEWERDSGR